MINGLSTANAWGISQAKRVIGEGELDPGSKRGKFSTDPNIDKLFIMR